jgi:hypothetical protein
MRSKFLILTILISIFTANNLEARDSTSETYLDKHINHEIIYFNELGSKPISNINQELKISNASVNNSSNNTYEDMVLGIIGFLIFFVLPLLWKPSRKAIGLMNIIIGTIISLTIIGALIGIPMIIYGGILFFI